MSWKFVDFDMLSALIEGLRRELSEAQRERDYFKGRCERLELMVIPQPAPPKEKTIHGTPVAIGRRPWNAILAEHEEKQAEEAKHGEEIRAQRNAKEVRGKPAEGPSN